jgi:threonine synthase
MMNTSHITYEDTRNYTDGSYTFCDVVIEGLAPGGGLFVPSTIPELTVDQICNLANLPYAERAAFVYRTFGVDLPDERISELMAGTYSTNFDDRRICPIVEVAPGMHVLELWHGPTSAFKDMALQCLPRFFSAAIEKRRAETGEEFDYLILTATSGDTGKAALEGFRDRPHTGIVVFYPDGGVSDIQYLQMATQRGDNVGVFGVEGNFDDCQTSVKASFNDPDFNERLAREHHIKLSSANSINWGRLLPQVVYYMSSYAEMVKIGAVEKGAPIDICVPTGNFGNILAAYYARRAGTPVERLLCASNENRVLTDFIHTGTYDISNRTFVLTPSPSMDILVSSNLERQIYELCGRDGAAVKGWMDDLKTKKCFTVDPTTARRFREVFAADSANSDECFDTIARVHHEHGYLLDPHSAVAWTVAERLKADRPVLIASTAHWAKFGPSVYRALHGIRASQDLPPDVAPLSGMDLNRRIVDETGAGPIPRGLAELESLPVRFTNVVKGSPSGIQSATTSFLEARSIPQLG